MRTVALTGGIASGKSVVLEEARQFESILGVEADKLAWSTYLPSTEVYRRIVECFGDEVTRGSGEIDRGKLGQIVFNCKDARADLESIVHPAVMNELRRIRLQKKALFKLMVVEGAPLIDSDYIDPAFFEDWLLVDAPPELRMKRLINRDDIEEGRAANLISLQKAFSEGKGNHDFVIDSSGSEASTRRQARRLFEKLLASA
ncbi:MAG: dephospho-CoA kinase [Candidatus Acetothermia bacterium]